MNYGFWPGLAYKTVRIHTLAALANNDYIHCRSTVCSKLLEIVTIVAVLLES
jgi:hypothetical protein